MPIAPGQTISKTFYTLDNNRVIATPSAGPTAIIRKDGDSDGTTSATITGSAGTYKIVVTPSAALYAERNSFQVFIQATIGGNVVIFPVIDEVLSSALDVIEELCDQIAADQQTENTLLTSVEAKANATNTAVQTSGVVLTTGAISAVQSAIESDPQMQLMMALTGIMGGTRPSYTGGVATYSLPKPGGGTVTVVHNETEGSWTVS